MSKVNYTYKAELVRVIDGDTVVLNIDLGHSIWIKRHIRLSDVYAPEIRTKDKDEKALGFKVKEYLNNLLINKKIVVKTIDEGKFGRWLGIIWSDGIDVNNAINKCLREMKWSKK